MSKVPNTVQKFIKNKIQPKEKVAKWLTGYIGEMMGSGSDRQINGMLILTTQRVVFYKKNLLSEHIKSVPLVRISSIDTSKVLTYKKIHITSTPEDLVFKTLEPKGLIGEFVETAQIYVTEHNSPTVAAPTTSKFDDLQKLADLHEQGILTKEEFEAEKKKILGT